MTRGSTQYFLRGSSLVVHRCVWSSAKREPNGNIEHMTLFEKSLIFLSLNTCRLILCKIEIKSKQLRKIKQLKEKRSRLFFLLPRKLSFVTVLYRINYFKINPRYQGFQTRTDFLEVIQEAREGRESLPGQFRAEPIKKNKRG